MRLPTLNDNTFLQLKNRRVIRISPIRGNKIRLSIQDGPNSMGHDWTTMDCDELVEFIEALREKLAEVSQ